MARHLSLARLYLWLPLLVYMWLIFHLSSESNPLPELREHVWDKLLHTTEYGGLGLLMCRALLGEGLSRTWAVLGAIMLSSAYGATDEWHQAFVPLRSSDVLDWVADSIGSSMGTACYALGAWLTHSRVTSASPVSSTSRARPKSSG